MVKKQIRVLIRSKVAGLGEPGQIKAVSAGYARNYLLPKKLAVEASTEVVAQAAAATKQKETRTAAVQADAQLLAKKIEGKNVTLRVKAGVKGKLFGSVSEKDILRAVKEQLGLSLSDNSLKLAEPFKSLGKHNITVSFGPGVKAQLSIQILSSKS